MINKSVDQKKHVAVLMGGWNSEKDVSNASGEAVYKALIELGYKATKVDFDREIYAKLKDLSPDVVFNALHGQYGEDGRIQGLLDILEIPYTHSGVITSALCMNKVLTKEICSDAGIKSADYFLLRKTDSLDAQRTALKKFGKPFVIKPIDEGSSFGVEIILKDTQFDAKDYHWKYGAKVIVERYIKGRELQVAVIGQEALGVMEVRPNGLFFDYQSKYVEGMAEHIMPAKIDERKYQEVLNLALKACQATGCRHVSRVEFLFDESDGEIYLLELNTQPGFTPISIVPEIAKHKNISFNDIVQYLVKSSGHGPKYSYSNEAAF